ARAGVREGREPALADAAAPHLPAHAVGGGEQPRPGVDRVLVVAADQTAVGTGGVAQRETHRTLLTCALPLPVVVCVVVRAVVMSAAPARSGRCGSAGREPRAAGPGPAAGRGRC